MRSRVIVFSAGLLGALALSAPTSASHGGLCPIGSGSGADYAHQHIVPLAHAGALGQMHKPGSHQGFSNCAHQSAPGQ